MATQTVNLASHDGESGTTMQLRSIDTLALVQSALATEVSPGLYTANFTDAPAASYIVMHVDAAGEPLWISFVVLTLSTATFLAHEAALASGGGGGGGLDAAGVRAAVGLASANLDTQLNGIAVLATSADGKLDGIAASATSVDGKLTAGRLSRIDRLPDIVAGDAGGLAIVGSEMGLSSAVLTALFSDADIAAMVNTIIARIETDLDGADVSVQAIAVAVRDSLLTAWATGTQVFGHSYLESIKRIEMASGAATLSGAGTGTEVMTSSDASKTATFTVDDDGNVSAVVWS